MRGSALGLHLERARLAARSMPRQLVQGILLDLALAVVVLSLAVLAFDGLAVVLIAAYVGALMLGWRLWALTRPTPGALPRRVHERLVERTAGPLTVRPPQPGDAAGFVATIDDVVVRANGWRPEDAALALSALAYPLVAGELGVLLAVSAVDGHVVGCFTLSDLRADDASAQVGFWIGPRDRGRGHGSAAIALGAAVAARAGVRRLRIATAADNAAMQRAIERAGGVLVAEGTHTLPNGTVIPSRAYELDTGACGRRIETGG